MDTEDESIGTPKHNRGAEKKPHNSPSTILSAAQRFIVDTEALEELLHISRPVLEAKRDEHLDELGRLLAAGTPLGEARLRLDLSQLHRLMSLAAKLERGSFLFRGHLLVALVSRFDAFVSSIARELLSKYPERIGKRTLTYSDAAQFTSIAELRIRFIDEEIDSKMRESHEEQLKFLSLLANVPLARDEPVLFAKFIELTERRNCHIHYGGNVSPQYRRVCSQHKVQFEEQPRDGESQSLDVTVPYFSDARKTLSEMAFKISQTIVRKVFDQSTGAADRHVSMLGMQMLEDKRWEEALMMFDYASSLHPGWAGDESTRRDNIINKAQALIGLRKSEAAFEAINSMDWSASHPKYVMAIHLLKGKFNEAAALMPAAGLTEDHYRKWPIFASFRSTEPFRSAFSILFGHDFDQTTQGAISEARAVIEGTGAISLPAASVSLEGAPEPDRAEAHNSD